VINLALASSPDAQLDEAELVASNGMEYIHIPVVWEAPTTADLAKFFAVMEMHRDMAVLVHCVKNYRASVFVFLWRVLHNGEPLEEARQAILSVWTPDETWQTFIEHVLAG
jgi:protein tyrosine phosphatase (PTP) superfamily phosphohydrolase (DUF442 family)